MKRIVVFTVVFVIIIGLLLTLNVKEKNSLVSVKSVSKNFISFGCYMQDAANSRTLKAFVREDKFKGRFVVDTCTNQDLYFDVILINNYSQVEFSINNSTFDKKHKIFIPKSNGDEFISSNLEISISDLNSNLNDCLLIFIRDTDNLNDDKNRQRKKCFVTRFAVQNDSISAKPNASIDSQYLSDCKVLDGPFEDSNMVFNKELESIEDEYYKDINLSFDVKSGDKLKIPFCFNTKNSIINSRFFNEFIEDEKLGNNQNVAVFILVDGILHPANYDIGDKRNVAYYNVKLGKTIFLSPELELDESLGDSLVIVTVCYPYSDPEQLFKTYKITNWSTIISTEEIKLNYND